MTLPTAAATLLETRKAVYQADDPMGDMTPELAEAMALQDVCDAELRRLENRVGTADVCDLDWLRSLAETLAAL